MSTPLRIDAHPAYIVATNIAGALIGTLALFGLSRIPLFLSPLVFLLCVVGLLIAFAADTLIWMRRGIRSLELDPEGLTLFRGASMVAERVQPADVRRIRIMNRPWGKKTVLMVAVPSRRRSCPGFWRRARITIREDAFAREDFIRFLLVLDDWRPKY